MAVIVQWTVWGFGDHRFRVLDHSSARALAAPKGGALAGRTAGFFAREGLAGPDCDICRA